MKKVIFAFILLLSFLFTTDVFASKKTSDYFFRPQAGVWFGIATPLFEVADQVDTDLAGGGYFRYNTPFQSLKLGFDLSYQNHSSDSLSELTLIPAYGSLIYWLPINFPINFQLKAGAGLCYVSILPDDKNQRDPMFTFGGEMSFPAGNRFNIGLRLDYILVYEKHIDGAQYNGHFFNAGLTLYLNI